MGFADHYVDDGELVLEFAGSRTPASELDVAIEVVEDDAVMDNGLRVRITGFEDHEGVWQGTHTGSTP